jgi:hypothetical protein
MVLTKHVDNSSSNFIEDKKEYTSEKAILKHGIINRLKIKTKTTVLSPISSTPTNDKNNDNNEVKNVINNSNSSSSSSNTNNDGNASKYFEDEQFLNAANTIELVEILVDETVQQQQKFSPSSTTNQKNNKHFATYYYCDYRELVFNQQHLKNNIQNISGGKNSIRNNIDQFNEHSNYEDSNNSSNSRINVKVGDEVVFFAVQKYYPLAFNVVSLPKVVLEIKPVCFSFFFFFYLLFC